MATRPSSVAVRSADSVQPSGERVPERERREQAEHRAAERGAAGDRQGAHRGADEDDPPDRDPDLAALRHVVAAVREREVEDEDRGHQPGDESAGIQAQLGDVAEAKRAQGLAVDGFHHH